MKTKYMIWNSLCQVFSFLSFFSFPFFPSALLLSFTLLLQYSIDNLIFQLSKSQISFPFKFPIILTFSKGFPNFNSIKCCQLPTLHQ